MLRTNYTLRDEFTAYVPSRPHLEWQLGRWVRWIANFAIVRRSILAPRLDRSQHRVTGVLVDSDEPKCPEVVCAELVTDATIHGIRLPVWLSSCGCRKTTEDTVYIGIYYDTHQLGIPEGLVAEKVVVTGVSMPYVICAGTGHAAL
ncbi:hypothetical protein [Mycobacterium lepromatosis]|uniref:hypothetical protein n=1 Tax=Mycobacterium lepromatosis TaxID=480418 RepID=UPI001EDBEA15|nr:hypothetical protein [Mycobacterium lepromatosis]